MFDKLFLKMSQKNWTSLSYVLKCKWNIQQDFLVYKKILSITNQFVGSSMVGYQSIHAITTLIKKKKNSRKSKK